jgi:hypothetical protein
MRCSYGAPCAGILCQAFGVCRRIVPTLALMAASGCGDSDSAAGTSVTADGQKQFFQLLRESGFEATFQHVPFAVEMAGYSDLVILGEIERLEPGGIVDGARSSVAKTRVLQTIKGEAAGSAVYIELVHGPNTSAEELNTALPVPAGLWFLQHFERVFTSPTDEGRGELGLPSGEALLGPASNQGLVMEEHDALVQPLEPDRDQWFVDIEDYASLQEMVDFVAEEASKME